MGKLLCESSTVQETFSAVPLFDQRSNPPLDPISTVDLSTWHAVPNLDEQQRRNLQRLETKGVLWTNGEKSEVFRLSHGGEVSADGNCLFTATAKAMKAEDGAARELRRRVVRRFVESEEVVDGVIKGMYCPDLMTGWGVHVVQEVKLLAEKSDRVGLDREIHQLVNLGMQRELAAESIYKERCIPVNDGASWAKYMSISGSPDDEYDIITLQYTEEGLLSVEENRDGRAAAFGDDIAIECLATEFKREVYVVQAHGSDAMVDEEDCVFFLPHRPRTEICEPPLFLFMKGTGWCGAGGDHYEPLIAHSSSISSQEKVAVVL